MTWTDISEDIISVRGCRQVRRYIRFIHIFIPLVIFWGCAQEIQDRVDRTFNEESIPLWLIQQERQFRDSVIAASEFNYRQSAAESRQRISARCIGNRYTNA
jgi:hypothetical protein